MSEPDTPIRPRGLHIRQLRAEDAPALAAGFARLSASSRMRRFHCAKPSLSAQELRYLTEIDHRSHEALVATEPGDGSIVAVARYAALPGEPTCAELAVVVADDRQGRGVATTLCTALVARAAENGITRMVSTTKLDNAAARNLTARLGFVTTAVTADGVEAHRDIAPPARRLFDAHLHIIDPAFPITENQGYRPPAFTAEDYRRRVAGLGVVGGAVVSGSFQGFDQRYLVAALRQLGPGFAGVTQLPPSVSDEQILELDAGGVRALRFNVRRGGSAGLRDLDRMARRVFDLAGWHVELYIDARDLADISGTVASLPAVSIDHLGLSAEGLPELVRLAARGVRVKAAGFGRVDLPVGPALRAIHTADPRALMFGTDLPSTRAPRPFRESDVELIADALGEDGARAVLHDNAVAFYRP